MKHLFAVLVVLCYSICCYCLTLPNAETAQETEALPFVSDFSVSLNPIDAYPSQQLQQRLLPVGLFLVPKVIFLSQQNSRLEQSASLASTSILSVSSSVSTVSEDLRNFCISLAAIFAADANSSTSLNCGGF